MLEKEFIGTLIQYPEEIKRVYAIVHPGDFTNGDYRVVYECLLEIYFDLGETCISIVYDKVRAKRPDISPVTMTDFYEIPAFRANSVPLANKLHDMAVKRKIAGTLQDKIMSCGDGDMKSTDILAEIESEVIGYRHQLHDIKSNNAKDAVEALAVKIENYRTGKEVLITNEMPGTVPAINVLVPGHFVFLASYTSSGKTAFAINWSMLLALAGHKIAYFTLELTREQIASRMLSWLSGISYNQILTGKYYQYHNEDIIDNAKSRLSELNIKIYSQVKDIDKLAAEVRRIRSSGHAEFVVIDHLGLASAKGDYGYHMMTNVAHATQAIAIDNNCIVLGLQQISNDDAKNPNYNIIGGKDTGWFGADSHVAMLLHRPEKTSPMAKLIIQKNSMLGPLQKSNVFFSKNWTRFMSEQEFMENGGIIMDDKQCLAKYE